MKNKVKEYRERKGWSQEKLAEKSSVSRNTISALETGKSVNVTYDIMIKLSEALEKAVSTIFFKE